MHQLIRHTVGPFLLLLLAGLLCSCAKVNDTGLGLVSTKRDAFLIVNGQLLKGEVVLVPDRTGRASFSVEKGTISSCSGGMRYTATNNAEVDLRCSDGTQVALQIMLLSETRGYGYGSTAKGPSSMVFGMDEPDVRAFLTVPSGMALAPGEGGALELR
jgi:hypothetical protein